MIQINDKLRITRRDQYNIIVEELKDIYKIRRDENGDAIRDKNDELVKDFTGQKWIVTGYYGNLEDAFVGLLRNKLNDIAYEDILSIKDVNKNIESVKEEIKSMIKILNKNV